MKPKILHLITNLTVGGAEVHLRELLSGLNRDKYHLEVAYFYEFPGSPPLRDDFEALGLAVHHLDGRSRLSLGALGRLIRLIRNGRFDIVHTHLFRADLYGSLAARFSPRTILINSVHNPEDFYAKRWVAALGRWAARRQAKTLVISKAVGDHLAHHLNLPPERMELIYYGHVPKKRQGYDIRQEYHIPSEAPVVGTVGRLAKQKGQDHLIRAMAQVCRRLPEARCLIVGLDAEGLGPRLQAEIDRLELTDRVILTGFRSQIPDVMAAFDVFCLPSLWEGFGMVLIEAMAEARPVVASRAGSIPEVVEEGVTGLLIEPGDEAGLADALLRLLTDRKLAAEMGAAGRRRQERLYSRRAMVESTERLYDDMLNAEKR